MSLPRYPKDFLLIIVKLKGRNNTFKDVTVRKQKVYNALLWLTQNNPHCADLNSLPVDGVPTVWT